MLKFDAKLRAKGEDSFKEMWAAISTLALWLNEDEMGPFISKLSQASPLCFSLNSHIAQTTKMATRSRL